MKILIEHIKVYKNWLDFAPDDGYSTTESKHLQTAIRPSKTYPNSQFNYEIRLS